MGCTSRGILVGLTLLVPGLASAEPFGVRISRAGLDELEPIILSKVPGEIPVPEKTLQVFDCPFTSDDIVATARNGRVRLGVHSLDLTVGDGVASAHVVVDVDAAAQMEIDNVYACLGSTTCEVGATLTPLSFDVDVRFTMGGGGELRVAGVDVGLAIEADDFHLNIDDCPGGDALEWVIEAVDGWVLEMVTPAIEKMAETVLAAKIAALVTDSVPLHLEKGAFAIDATLVDLELSAATGVTLVGDAQIGLIEGDDEGAPSSEDPKGHPLPAEFAETDVAVAASDGLVTTALYYAWRSGLLATTMASMAPTIELSDDGVAQKLGLPSGTRIEMAMDLAAPARMAFGRDERGILVDLGELEVELTVNAPGEPASSIIVRVMGRMVGSPGTELEFAL